MRYQSTRCSHCVDLHAVKRRGDRRRIARLLVDKRDDLTVVLTTIDVVYRSVDRGGGGGSSQRR